MFWFKGKCLVYNSISLLSLSIIFFNILRNISHMTWTTPSSNCKHPWMCVHTSYWPYGYLSFILCSWQRTHWNPWCNLQNFCRHCTRWWLPCGTKTITCASFSHIQLLLLTRWHCAYQRWHSHPSQWCHWRPNLSIFTSSILHNSRIFHLQCSLSQGKGLSQPTPH